MMFIPFDVKCSQDLWKMKKKIFFFNVSKLTYSRVCGLPLVLRPVPEHVEYSLGRGQSHLTVQTNLLKPGSQTQKH